MEAFLVWAAVILILGGVMAAVVGHMWEETAKLLDFFDKDLNEKMGFRVMMGGLAAALAGVGLVYLFR